MSEGKAPDPARRRLPWVSRGAFARLGLLFLALAAALVWWVRSMTSMPGTSYRGPLPAAGDDEKALAAALRVHVEKLAGEIGNRDLFHARAGLDAAAAYIEAELGRAGFAVERQAFEVRGELVHNLIVELPGRARDAAAAGEAGDGVAKEIADQVADEMAKATAKETIVVGAHYDTCGNPGANDNASGVAALLELARRFAVRPWPRTLRFVAFVNEEPPFFGTESMGSLVYARRCRDRGERIVAMLSLETLGYYTDAPESQKYPPPFGLLYPSTGNFIGFVGNRASADLVRRAVGVFRAACRFPCEGGALPASVPGVGWSDHWSFWEAGYPALMVTDTAPFRYPHYHEPSDTPEKLDYERLARVVAGLEHVVAALASGAGE